MLGNAYKELVKEYTLPHQIKVRCLILVPDVYSDENTAPAMGRCANEKNENLEKFAEEVLGPQYVHFVRKSVELYEASDLPMKFIKGQNVRIEVISGGMRGVYDKKADIIIEDADTTLMDKNTYIFGWCMGRKLLNVRSNAEEALKEISSILVASNDYLLREVFCEEVGNIIAKTDFPSRVLSNELPEYKVSGIRKEIMRMAWGG